MSQAEEFLRDGNLQEALNTLQAAVRKQPAKAELRTFLFQLLSVLGNWDRALAQLDVVGELEAATLPMVHTYRSALACEALRKEIYNGHKRPVLFGEPDQWIALLMEALALDRAGNLAGAQSTREAAFEAAPATVGTIDGAAFSWIADADQRLGPILECVMNGNFYWIPFYRIQRIQFDAPVDLRDFVWMPAEFTWVNGGQAVGLIPTRYPDTENSGDAQLMLARKTDWRKVGAGVYTGLGQRMLVTDVGEYPLLDCRRIVLEVETPPGSIS